MRSAQTCCFHWNLLCPLRFVIPFHVVSPITTAQSAIGLWPLSGARPNRLMLAQIFSLSLSETKNIYGMRFCELRRIHYLVNAGVGFVQRWSLSSDNKIPILNAIKTTVFEIMTVTPHCTIIESYVAASLLSKRILRVPKRDNL